MGRNIRTCMYVGKMFLRYVVQLCSSAREGQARCCYVQVTGAGTNTITVQLERGSSMEAELHSRYCHAGEGTESYFYS